MTGKRVVGQQDPLLPVAILDNHHFAFKSHHPKCCAIDNIRCIVLDSGLFPVRFRALADDLILFMFWTYERCGFIIAQTIMFSSNT